MSIREAEKRAMILLVEDDVEVAWVLKILLEREGYSIVVTQSGKEALEILGLEPAAQPAGSIQPDLILLDVMMERLDGFQVCERIRLSEGLSYTPIIMLTVRDLPEDKVKGLDCGANDYITKPFSNTELLARVRTQLRIKRLQDEHKQAEESLRLLSSAVEQSSEGMAVSDLEGNLQFMNTAFAVMHGYAREEIAGKHLSVFHTPEQMPSVKAANRQIQETGEFSGEIWHVRRDGTTFPTLMHNSLLRDERGNPMGMIGTLRDITERKQAEEALQKAHEELERRVKERTAKLAEANALLQQEVAERKRMEEALRQSEKRYRHLFDNAPLCIFEMDVGQTLPIVIRANHQAEQVYGWSSEEFAAASLEQIVPSETMSDLAKIAEALAAGQAITQESINRRRDGSVFPVRISATPEAASIPEHAVIIVEDITVDKTRRSEEAAIAEERGRIAREIHDGLAQDLASLRLRVRLWHDLVDHDPAQMHAELDTLRELLSKNINEVRRSIFALRPVSLDELGFYPALRQFASDFGDQNQLQVDLCISGPENRLPSRLEPVLFRIIQEALNNVGKHARASAAWVELDLTAAHSMTLMVRDNGLGFDLAILDTAPRRGRLGLKQMRERAEELEGTFAVQSEVGKGTRIQVVLPLPQS